MSWVYVLQCTSDEDRFYIGFTGDLEGRLSSHNGGHNRSTRGVTWRIVYCEAYMHERAARQRERILKHDGRSRRALMERIRDSLGCE